MDRALRLTVVLPLLLAASSSAALSFAPASDSAAIRSARSEAARAETEEARLSNAASKERSQAGRLAAERLAAAAGIAAAEARISEADAFLAQREAAVRAGAARLSERQAPAAALVAGIVNLGRRPPLVSLADRNSLAELVRMRTLLDAAVPYIRARSARLAAEIEFNRALVEGARAARRQLDAARVELSRRQRKFAALEARSLSRAASLDAGALGAGDRMMVASEGLNALGSEQQRADAARRRASELALLPPAPPRPFAPDSSAEQPPFALSLPVDAPVTGGLGQVSDSGIRSRGLTFASRAGMRVIVPADGTLVFAGPFRRHDGVAIIDHGHGWMTMLVGVRATETKGARLARGALLGRAIGPISFELSTRGRPVSAALIAGSSRSLSIKANGG